MRQFKFRDYDKVNKKWLLGYEYPNLGGFSLVGETVLFGEFANLFRRLERINEIEITECTDLKDKNGKEIYEGDILQGVNTYRMIVIKGKYGWETEILISPTEKDNMRFDDDLFTQYDVEIIGNIYENPELIKELNENNS